MKLDRNEFIERLEAVAGGLSNREIIDQADCVVFKSGMMRTFNDEISCQIESGLEDDFEGAVRGKALIESLKKRQAETLVVAVEGNALIFKPAKGRWRIKMNLEADAKLPSVDLPKKWRKASADFVHALNVVRTSAGKDDSRFVMTCVHFTPDHVEACDDFQILRYSLKTGLGESLVRASSLEPILSHSITEVGETDSWLHFKTKLGAICSCRRMVEDYPDVGVFIRRDDGMESIKFPELKETIAAASVFTNEKRDGMLQIKLRSGKMLVVGEGDSGRSEDQLTVEYGGDPITFVTSPQLLSEIVGRGKNFNINVDRLVVDGADFEYAACLGRDE